MPRSVPRLLLTQDVFLLAHDEESGKNTASIGLEGALAAALVLDLAERELIDVDDDDVVLTGAEPDEALLAQAVAAIRDEPKRKKVGHWLYQLPRKLKPFPETVGTSLVERGILGQESAKTWGLFTTTRWPERDPRPEQELRAELHGVLVDGLTPTPRVLLLAGVLFRFAMLDRLVEKDDRKVARRRAEEIAKQAESGDAISKALGDAARSAQAAAMTAVMTSTIAATTVTVSTS